MEASRVVGPHLSHGWVDSAANLRGRYSCVLILRQSVWEHFLRLKFWPLSLSSSVGPGPCFRQCIYSTTFSLTTVCTTDSGPHNRFTVRERVTIKYQLGIQKKLLERNYLPSSTSGNLYPPCQSPLPSSLSLTLVPINPPTQPIMCSSPPPSFWKLPSRPYENIYCTVMVQFQ